MAATSPRSCTARRLPSALQRPAQVLQASLGTPVLRSGLGAHRGELVVVTGMTGAGRSTAAKELEDLGYFVVDNLPPQLVPDVVRLVDESQGVLQPIAVVADTHSSPHRAIADHRAAMRPDAGRPGPSRPARAGRPDGRAAPDGRRTQALMRWGLIPSWAKDPSIGSKLINARSETITEKPSFRVAFAKRRCLILADGFYEWKSVGKVKEPYRFVVDGGALYAGGFMLVMQVLGLNLSWWAVLALPAAVPVVARAARAIPISAPWVASAAMAAQPLGRASSVSTCRRSTARSTRWGTRTRWRRTAPR